MGKPFYTTLTLPDTEAVTRHMFLFCLNVSTPGHRCTKFLRLMEPGLRLLRVQFLLPIIPYYGQNNNTLLQLRERP